jgi:hypothetical protein
MRLQNTFTGEDRAIEVAKSSTDDLLDIIKRLDSLIEDWKEATGCDSPEEVKERKDES